jgi:pyruvate/2-oxoglutarate dehydrogenase complex dihydrolipoamide acyltransferase (E2) component
MRMTVKMPRAADTVDEFVVSEWVVEPGAVVAAGDPIMRVETDKAVVEVPTPVAGTFVEQLVAVDDEISTGAPIAVIESS